MPDDWYGFWQHEAEMDGSMPWDWHWISFNAHPISDYVANALLTVEEHEGKLHRMVCCGLTKSGTDHTPMLMYRGRLSGLTAWAKEIGAKYG